jgi:thiol-disulfide isomerase/thioredoxin
MAATPSTMVPLGSPAPSFSLPDTVSGRTVTLDHAAGATALVVMFICNHCPFVKHIRAQVAQLVRDYTPRGVSFLAISSNDADKYPDDSPAKMKEEAAAAGYSFPYLYDETQQVARSFRAACTPDFFVYDASRTLAYRGQLDDSRPKNDTPVTGRDLRAALDALLAARPVNPDQRPSIGCNIKWKPGNEPAP